MCFILSCFVSIQIAFSQSEIEKLMLNRQYPEALNQIKRRLQQEPDSGLYFQSGLVSTQLQDFQGAAEAFGKALELNPDSPEILAELAEANATLGNFREAARYYEQAVSLSPGNLPLMGKLGRTYISLKLNAKAYAVFSSVYEKDSTNIYWNKQLAYCSFRTGNNSRAIQLYEKLIQQNPGDLNLYLNLATIYQSLDKFVLLENLFERGLAEFPGEPSLLLKQGNYFFGNKFYEKAKPAFEGYLASGDSALEVIKNYGICLYFSKEEQSAVLILEKYAEKIPNDPIVLFYLSLSNKKLAQHDLAEAYMKAAIESATPFYLPEMYHHLGQIFGQQRKFAESIEALKKANELDPTDFEVLFEIATTYEEFSPSKTLALNYYQVYLNEAGQSAKNYDYAVNRIKRIKEDLFME